MSDAAGWIPPNTPCVACGYDLAGLRSIDNCPECGAPASRSLRGHLLHHASPDFVRTLHVATRAILVLILVNIGLGVAGLAGMFIAFTSGSASTLTPTIQSVATLMSLVVTLGASIAWWLLATPDPRTLDRPHLDLPWRRAVRVCAVLGACLALASLALPSTQSAIFRPGRPMPVTGTALLVLVPIALSTLVLHIFTWIAQMLYLAHLAQRLPSDWAQRRARLLAGLGPALDTIGALMLMLGPLVALLLYWQLLNRIRWDLRAIRLAQEYE